MSERRAVELRIWAWTDADDLDQAIADALVELGFNRDKREGPVAAIGVVADSDELVAWKSSPEGFLNVVWRQVDSLTIPNGGSDA